MAGEEEGVQELFCPAIDSAQPLTDSAQPLTDSAQPLTLHHPLYVQAEWLLHLLNRQVPIVIIAWRMGPRPMGLQPDMCSPCAEGYGRPLHTRMALAHTHTHTLSLSHTHTTYSSMQLRA